MLTYIQTKDESKCCGCRACEQACPKDAIIMAKNHEGFLYPQLNEKLCVNCGICEKVCPVMQSPDKQKIRSIFAVQHKDNEILKKSSSGGAFRLLADHVIENGGCVAGCVWDENYNPVFSIAKTIPELLPMQGSKYLSSNTLNVYSEIEKELKNGKTVLFTGAPCQCAGLLKYLRKPYENLITADFLCHGMPSQEIFDYYLDSIEKKHGISKSNGRALHSYSFRDKEKRGWGLVTSYTYQKNGNIQKRYNVGLTDSYDYGFLSGYFNRYSCYSCPFRGSDRFTDFTFCDYWGIEKFIPDKLDYSKGCSALSVNSSAAEMILEQLKGKAIIEETQVEYVARDNSTLVHTEKENIPALRREMYNLLRNNSWKTIAKKHLRPKKYMIKRVWYSIPVDLAKKIKKVIKVK